MVEMGLKSPPSGPFDRLAEAVELYLTPSDALAVYQAYAIASGAIDGNRGLTNKYLNLSLATAIDLAALRIAPEYLAGVLLYFPLSAGALGESVLLPRSPLTARIQTAASQLLQIGDVFDPFLPWRPQAVSEAFHEAAQQGSGLWVA